MGSRRGSLALALAAVTVLGAAARLWRLEVPPSWLDESVTALIAAGRGPDALPFDRVLPMQRIADLFDPHLTATAADALAVFHDPRVQDLHPPTYHLLANAALRAGLYADWLLVPRVRALAALLGIAAIVATHFAARQAFDSPTALTAAALMAASPFAVMLSREARNYSAATLLVACSLGACLALVRRIEQRRAAIGWWIAWACFSAAGLYVHYFTLFAFVAQAIALAWTAWRGRAITAQVSLAIACAGVVAAFAPWVGTLITQQASPEQHWLTFAIYRSSPFDGPYKVASACQTMLLGKAWDLGEPTYAITRAVALLIYLGVLAALASALRRTSSASAEDRAIRLVFAIAGLTMLEYIVAMGLQRKDFVSEVRYQYAYYVPFAVGVAWVFARRLPVAATIALVAVGLVNSAMVDLDIESWKGTDPSPVLERLNAAPQPTLFVAGSGSFNETVVYGTVLYALVQRSGVENRNIAFVARTPLYASFDIHANPSIFWEALGRLRPDVLPASVMVHSSGMLPDEYRPSLIVTSASGATAACTGQDLDDSRFAMDNALIRPLYRRYLCEPGAGAAGR